ncbi:hypothetical protein QE152_g26118 [Popillia japonica]|uniref:Uncharacterized protein n=1 Tax=Popillia japonica TaxID=7064 RepID=A0AAW1JZC8_POPJA
MVKMEGKTYADLLRTIRKKLNSSEVGVDLSMVKMEGKTYADLLRTIRKKLNSSEVGVDLSNVRKTKKGELLIAMRYGSDKFDTLKREITDELLGASTTTLVDKKILRIKELDEVITVEEVAQAIIRETSAAPNSFTVRALRPAFGNKQHQGNFGRPELLYS